MDADVFTSILGGIIGIVIAFGLCPIICLLIKKKTLTMVIISWIIPVLMIYGNHYNAKVSGEINGLWLLKHGIAIGIVMLFSILVTIKYCRAKKIMKNNK